MSHKRARKQAGGAPGWDVLPWKAIEPPLERDDGWKAASGDEQALMYTLEEISGSDYALHHDRGGGSQVLVAATSTDKPAADVEPAADSKPAVGAASSAAAPAAAAASGGGSDKRKPKKKGEKRQAPQPRPQGQAGGAGDKGEGEGQEEAEEAHEAVSSSNAAGADADGGAGAGAGTGAGGGAGVAAAGGGANASGGGGGGGAGDGEARVKRKKRRGLGNKKKKKANAVAAAVAAAAAAAGGGKTAVPVSAGAAGGAGAADPTGGSTATKNDKNGGSGGDSDACGGDGTVEASRGGGKQKQERVLAEGQATEGGTTDTDAQPAAANPKAKKRRRDNENRKKLKNKKRRMKRKLKEAADGGGDDGGDGASRKVGRDWELGVEEAAEMAPWLYLGVELHPALVWHLHRQGFHDPTPIQRRVLPKAILGRKDIIGAAETGSGKTLAFGLPVLSEILTRRDAVAAAAAAARKEAEEASMEEEEGEGGNEKEGKEGGERKEGEEEVVHQGLQALVLCPTRELALQVAAHLSEVVRDTGIAVVAVVGGLAEVKQERQLSRRPEVVVATPGRFWEMAGTHAHLSRLETLRHLVVDEADRMLERGHYPELQRLFAMIDKAEGREEGGEGAGSGGGGSGRGAEAGGGKRPGGHRGKRYKLPFDISEGGDWSVPVEEGSEASPSQGDASSAAVDTTGAAGATTAGADALDAMDEDEGDGTNDADLNEDLHGDQDPEENASANSDQEVDVGENGVGVGVGVGGATSPSPAASEAAAAASSSAGGGPPARDDFARQTYVFSATLTLGQSGRQQRKGKSASSGAAAAAVAGAKSKGKGKGRGGGAAGEEDPVTKIMNRVGVRGDPAVIDMGRRTLGGEGGEAGGAEEAVVAGEGGGEAEVPALPATLRLCSIKSLQMEKDVHAYLFCASYPGRTLIFVNAIACARRLAVLLCSLKIPATPLHAQMQQRQRLKSLDRFTSDPKAVLVATDVAARGLDIPKVEHVVHYDAARSAEVFIHRAGRTARARAAGLSLSIVAPRDDANHRQTCKVLGLHDGMKAFPQEVRLVERARERVGMALRVLKFQEQQNRVSASNDFFRGLSKDADLVMDGDLLMDHAEGSSGAGGQGRGGGEGLGRKGNQHAARLAAEARRALEVSLSRPLHSDRRKLIPVAQALTEMREVSQRTAAGDLVGKQKTRTGNLASPPLQQQ